MTAALPEVRALVPAPEKGDLDGNNITFNEAGIFQVSCLPSVTTGSQLKHEYLGTSTQTLEGHERSLSRHSGHLMA
ncbi:Sorting Nexin-5 [Manis pentadactyla]|nr:Sorting Nexin-5 [Manis pentadactyla]